MTAPTMPIHPSDAGSEASSRVTYADRLREARESLTEATRRAAGGFPALRDYSDAIDGLVRDIGAEAARETTTPHALVAIGGYGRRHMCLHSDVDLLLLFGGPIGAAEERAIKAVLHPLWDLRLDVGQHIRELADTETVDADNPEYLVALLDARLVHGDQELFDRFGEACLRPGSPWEGPTLDAMRSLVRQRHTQHNHTLYELEPDVKDSPGALRDVSATRALERLAGRVRSDDRPRGRLAEAEDFVLRIRSILHLERGRNLNALTHELQETVAATFGSPGEPAQFQVESLMSAYFHHARIISRALTAAVKAVRPSAGDGPHAVEGHEDLVRWGREISFADGTRASLRPRTWLGAFEAALDHDGAVSDQVQTCIERHGGRYSPERFFPSERERDTLLRVLRPRAGLYDTLTQMHESGLLGRLFPEFQKVYCHVIRDFYHKYTVDEHTLLTIRGLEGLCAPHAHSRRRFAGILGEVAQPELLVLALLFHDVGKWTNRNHSEEGVRMAVPALRRIGLPERDIAMVEFLIRHHLKMSVVAFHRDSDDPEAVRQLARLVGQEERLKLLTLLTLVDVEAVGPDVMTPWKEELLWRLYVDTYNRLTLGHGDDPADADTETLESVLDSHPPDIEREELAGFLDGLPGRYLRTEDRSRLFDDCRLARDLGSDGLACSLRQRDANWELTVASVDQPRLYAKICGVLSFFGMDILRGQAMSNRRGMALDVFEFTDAEQFLELNATAAEELTHRLRAVVRGDEDIDEVLAPKTRGLARQHKSRVKQMVHLDNEYSGRFTILEIMAQNAWGLLYKISRSISQHGCDIDLVLASTEGDRAIDVFHVTRDGAKLSTSQGETLRDAVAAALADERPAEA